MTDSWPHHPLFPQEVALPGLGALPPFTHLFDVESVWAIRAALGARRPLLIRGEPGTGKSQLARAAAHVLRRPLIGEVIGARTEPQDLHYRFDAVARLGRAQLLGAGLRRSTAAAAADSQPERSLGELEEALFLQPGPLWWVFDWEGAAHQHARPRVPGPRPREPDPDWKWTPPRGTVLLIDEIDKADADLPNGLLESLGNGEFRVPYLSEPVCCAPGQAAPLVIITTNEERELPAAFVRRCLVLQLELPKGEALLPFLEKRGRAHFGTRCADAVYREAAQQLVKDRAAAEREAMPRPGQAEYLDLLRAVCDVTEGARQEPPGGAAPGPERAARQLDVLRAIQGFALKKNPPLSR